MKTLIPLFIVSGLYAQPYISAITPAPSSGVQMTYTVTIGAPLPGNNLNWYYLAFLPDTTAYPTQEVVAANSCTITLWYVPGNSFLTVSHDSGGAYSDNGGAVPLQYSFNDPQGGLANSQCRIYGDTQGSSVTTLGDGSIQLTLRMDWQQSYVGPKKLFFGSRSVNASNGPFYVGPWLVQDANGIWSTAYFVAGNTGFGMGANNTQAAVTEPVYLYSASLVNTSAPRYGQGRYYWINDPYTLTLIGPPNAPYVATRWQNNYQSSTLYGNLNSLGRLDYNGNIATNEGGFWAEKWTIDGKSTPLLTFTVAPQNGPPNFTSSITNLTRGGSTIFYYGDTFRVDVYGTPGVYVTRCGVVNETIKPQDTWVIPGDGHFTLTGTFQSGSDPIGLYVWSWLVAGVSAGPQLQFSVAQ